MRKVVVVGAGIVGLSTARALIGDGHSVTVVDRDPAGDKASFGNAGALGVTEILPISVPGLVWKVPGWLVDPLGPLSLRLRHFPKLAPWLLHFLKSGTRAEMLRVTEALAALVDNVYDDYLPLLDELGLSHELHRVGALWVYESESGFAKDAADRELRRHHGIIIDEMSGDEARRLEPALSEKVVRATATPQWAFFSDPKRVVDRLRAKVVERGATIVTGEAKSISGSLLQLADGRSIAFDRLVICAGAWSARIAATIGDQVRLESERGYNMTIPAPGVSLSRQVIFAERSFVATPMDMGLRIGGAAEFAGLEALPNHARSRALGALASKYLPGLKLDNATHWMGHRPTTPDSLPVIGPSPNRPDVVHAFGHSHIGLTLGPTTGRLVADIIAGRNPSVNLTPYSVNRFSKSRS